MYKFRTMARERRRGMHRDYVAALIREGGDELRNGEGAYKLENDPRITQRRARPAATEPRRAAAAAQRARRARCRSSVRGRRFPTRSSCTRRVHRAASRCIPGMTGLWQVSGRNETTFEQMVDLDLEYIERWSLAARSEDPGADRVGRVSTEGGVACDERDNSSSAWSATATGARTCCATTWSCPAPTSSGCATGTRSKAREGADRATRPSSATAGLHDVLGRPARSTPC